MPEPMPTRESQNALHAYGVFACRVVMPASPIAESEHPARGERA